MQCVLRNVIHIMYGFLFLCHHCIQSNIPRPGCDITKSSPQTRRCSAVICFVSLVSAFHFSPQTSFPMTPSLATSPSMAFSPYLNHMGPGIGLMPELLPSTPLLVPGSPTGLAAMANGTSSQKQTRTDKLEVCGLCAVAVLLCLAAV